MIYVPRSAQKGFAVGFWPIPEAFWPDINAATLVLLFPSHELTLSVQQGAEY